MQPADRIKEIQWRSEPAVRLLRRIEPLLSQIHATPPFDISFSDILGIPIYLVVRSVDLRATHFESLKEWGQLDFFHTHQGKGLTHEQSKVSCIMETLERYSASYDHFDQETVVSSYARLGKRALDPSSFFLPPGTVFDPDKPITWYEGVDLIHNETVLVPVDFAFINIPDSAYPFEGFQTRRMGFFLSNGLSAGSSIRETLVSGICEVVERDAQYRVAKGIPPPPKKLIVADDPDFSPWLDLYERCNLNLRVFCMDHIPGLYTVFAACWDPYCRLLVMGSACAPQIRFALQQALLEVAQQRAFTFFKHWKTRREYFPMVRYIRERIPPERYATAVPETYWTERCSGSVALSAMDENCPWDLESVLSSFSEQHRVVGLDLTNPHLGIPVVRVLISGLQNGYFVYQTALGFLQESRYP